MRTRWPSLFSRAAQRRAVIRLPLLMRNGAGVTSWIFTVVVLESAGAEAGPNIAPVRRVKISPGIANQVRRGCPTAAAQDFMRAEPWLGVFLVRIGAKAGKRLKVARRPLPDIADHLAASIRAIAVGVGADLDHPTGAPIQIRMIRRWRVIAPRKVSARCGRAVSLHCRRRRFPFNFRRQAAF